MQSDLTNPLKAYVMKKVIQILAIIFFLGNASFAQNNDTEIEYTNIDEA